MGAPEPPPTVCRASRAHYFPPPLGVLLGLFLPVLSGGCSSRSRCVPSLCPLRYCVLHARCSRWGALAPAGSMWCSCVLFGPGPKPRQARDGHSWRMVIHGEWRPLFSFCQRAPRLSSPSGVGGVGEGRGAAVRSEPLTRAHLPLWFAGSSWTRQAALAVLVRLTRFVFSFVTTFSPSRGGLLVCCGAHPSRAVFARFASA